MEFENIALKVPNILIPNKNIDLSKWTIIACDQYTSEPKYWYKVIKYVNNSPSTLNLIYPELFLLESKIDSKNRIDNINKTMKEYINSDVFNEFEGFVLVNRKTPHQKSRKGLVVAIDLEKYDYNAGSQTLIRASEKTILNRLPPRIKIRKNAHIELPHIMILIDDPKKTVIEPLFEEKLEVLYDFDLIQNAGHIKGYKIDSKDMLNDIAKNIRQLADKSTFNDKHNIKNKKVLLYAMGDGNHSLATAKAIWEHKKKKNGTLMTDNLRYALVELVNLHDKGLIFEPIHRVVFNADIKDMFLMAKKNGFEILYFNSMNDMDRYKTQCHKIKFVTKNSFGLFVKKEPKHNLEVGSLQLFLDKYLKGKKCEIDYIHGKESLNSLCKRNNTIGFILPTISKNELFRTVILNGALPRKTFSMGEASEKRFYLECRKLV